LFLAVRLCEGIGSSAHLLFVFLFKAVELDFGPTHESLKLGLVVAWMGAALLGVIASDVHMFALGIGRAFGR
jgi:hypothetical protein